LATRSVVARAGVVAEAGEALAETAAAGPDEVGVVDVLIVAIVAPVVGGVAALVVVGVVALVAALLVAASGVDAIVVVVGALAAVADVLSSNSSGQSESLLSGNGNRLDDAIAGNGFD
jgi:hypothetical protein